MLPIIRENKSSQAKLRNAIASAFFKDSSTPDKMAGNTLISLKVYSIIDENCEPTEFGSRLLALQDDSKAAHDELAKHILFKLGGIPLVETLREMRSAGSKFSLVGITEELRKRGFGASDNSSDLSGVLTVTPLFLAFPVNMAVAGSKTDPRAI